MTTREQLKRAVGGDRSDAARGVAAEPGPTLPERLYAARERKGVDLYRAERDTKIRARYLGALERGDYKELPGAVYTKGFLRNYALYLGLDPEDVLLQWRHERGDPKEVAPAIVVPKPIAAPRQGLTFSPSIVVVALLTVVILAFGAYLGIQILRFTKPPTVTVTQPATAVVDVDDTTTTYTLEGTSVPGATVSIATPGSDPLLVTASSTGAWAADVDLRRGRNQFDVSAVDPDTGKQSEQTLHLFITVPFLVIEAPTLTVDQPAEGASFENGAIPVAGHVTNASSVVVSAKYLGPSGPPPGAGGATPAPPPTPASVTAPVGTDGTYNTPLELTTGHWMITVTAASPEGKTTSLARNVTVAYKGVNLVVSVKGGRAWIKVWVDGKIDPGVGAAGQVLSNGKTLTFSGRSSVEVRSGSSGVTYFTLNGTSLGNAREVGRSGDVAVRAPEPARKDAAALIVVDDRAAGLAGSLEATDGDGPGDLVALAAQLGERCLALDLRITTVESCTGGLVAHLITEVPGSSGWFVGGFVTYSNALKTQSVGVGPEVLEAHGAVSAQVAMAMATGGRDRTGADLAVAVTGIAGPDGGTPAKPVGLTYIAVADAVGVAVKRHVWSGDRSANKRHSAGAALTLLLERVEASA